MSADKPLDANDENNELTPEVEAVINRARRSFGVSVLVLMVGFMAVAGALVYRLNQKSGDDVYQAQSVGVPQGATIVSAVVQDGLITLTYKLGDVTNIRVVNATSGEVVRDIAIIAEVPSN
ncbi:hypothetical protein [Maritalea porphyrae]|jgi:hypothetical protein|uniref:hypothetical protein n=1 Tax=Maritalea porphyrae TaxID=880732 RepID=UPI0022AEAEA6|nr:hypothetical protein [Maritalea porphyrae]MCZ4273644.1 hypothetical protein [Maritalea porphyrae]